MATPNSELATLNKHRIEASLNDNSAASTLTRPSLTPIAKPLHERLLDESAVTVASEARSLVYAVGNGLSLKPPPLCSLLAKHEISAAPAEAAEAREGKALSVSFKSQLVFGSPPSSAYDWTSPATVTLAVIKVEHYESSMLNAWIGSWIPSSRGFRLTQERATAASTPPSSNSAAASSGAAGTTTATPTTAAATTTTTTTTDKYDWASLDLSQYGLSESNLLAIDSWGADGEKAVTIDVTYQAMGLSFNTPYCFQVTPGILTIVRSESGTGSSLALKAKEAAPALDSKKDATSSASATATGTTGMPKGCSIVWGRPSPTSAVVTTLTEAAETERAARAEAARAEAEAQLVEAIAREEKKLLEAIRSKVADSTSTFDKGVFAQRKKTFDDMAKLRPPTLASTSLITSAQPSAAAATAAATTGASSTPASSSAAAATAPPLNQGDVKRILREVATLQAAADSSKNNRLSTDAAKLRAQLAEALSESALLTAAATETAAGGASSGADAAAVAASSSATSAAGSAAASSESSATITASLWSLLGWK